MSILLLMACAAVSGAYAAEPAALMAGFRDLGAPDPAKRKAALEKVKQAKQDAVPALLAMLHPKQDTDEFTRVGVLRALATLAPLPEQAAQTIGWTAVMDKLGEVRREACAVIRELQDDRALREILRLGLSPDPGVVRSAGASLREIDDMRALAVIVRAIPAPSVTANVGLPNQSWVQPGVTLPVGPLGTRMPIFLPKTEVSGVASDIGSPITELLKALSGKDFGNLPIGWILWFREKAGEIGTPERDAYRDHRSARDRMNVP